MVTAAFSFFVYYSQDRLSFYFKFTKNINVEVTYLDEVPFPAVTICNQNAFR
ncbi:hypothetical protein LSH36_1376g00011 [Paralvinella palmiformis]|uniref:Uncharacterized protein n=1 Tax=Paralvinella palmiformis TaxID=53620 RepID=A0AAD9IUL1_9ANNE|nr:hypothetical protein LSH36_1376g00011 [Paralvinella palmiformis]